MIRRITMVARREYLAYVRTKTFIVGALLLPAMFVLGIGIMALLESFPKPERVFSFLDETGRYGEKITQGILERAKDRTIDTGLRRFAFRTPEEILGHKSLFSPRAALIDSVRTRSIMMLFVLSDSGSSVPVLYSYAADLTEAEENLKDIVSKIASRAVLEDVLSSLEADSAVIALAVRGLKTKTRAVTERGAEAPKAEHFLRSAMPMILVYILWIGIMMSASHLITSTLEEKMNRTFEVLLSAVSPTELMTGKLLGQAAAGLTLIAIWLVVAGIGAGVVPRFVSSDQIGSLSGLLPASLLFWFIVFFLLAFLFIASMYVAIGSVCNTMREANSLAQPIVFVLVVPVMMMFYAAKNPDHIIVKVLSFIPPFSPFLMVNRLPASPPPPWWQPLVSAVILLAATVLVIQAAGRVFRIGILMYGKRPSLPEILRWARRSG